MPFFTGSSSTTIPNGHFCEIGGDYLNINLTTQEPAVDVIAQLSRKRKEHDDNESDVHGHDRKRHRCCSRNSDGLKVVNEDEIDMRRQLIKGNSYHIHSASLAGCVVAVKVFEGPHAKQDWTVNVAFAKKLLHSNIPRIIGISDECSENSFVIFRGISEMRMDLLIAKALRTDLNESVHLSMKAVKGIAAGLGYLESKKIPLPAGTLINNRKWENFDIFVGYDNEPIISIHMPDTISKGLVSPSVDSNDNGMEALNGLCEKLFSETNSILYRDSPERGFNLDDSEHTSNISKSQSISTPSNPTRDPKLGQTPRREVWWRLDVAASNPSLDSITRRFEDYLNCFISSSSDSPLRRINALKDPQRTSTRHQCPGYLREEITLTADVSRSAIISHEYPSQRELCSVCGQLVQYEQSPSNLDREREQQRPESSSEPATKINSLIDPGVVPPPEVVMRDKAIFEKDLSPSPFMTVRIDYDHLQDLSVARDSTLLKTPTPPPSFNDFDYFSSSLHICDPDSGIPCAC